MLDCFFFFFSTGFRLPVTTLNYRQILPGLVPRKSKWRPWIYIWTSDYLLLVLPWLCGQWPDSLRGLRRTYLYGCLQVGGFVSLALWRNIKDVYSSLMNMCVCTYKVSSPPPTRHKQTKNTFIIWQNSLTRVTILAVNFEISCDENCTVIVESYF